jgi:hypothetical protein
MNFKVGQKVCLWRVDHSESPENIRILKEVIVIITQIKIGAIGQLSKKPTPKQSLRGIGNDDNTYEKHWDRWPENPSYSFDHQWTDRMDGEPVEGIKFWIPQEAVAVWNDANEERKKYEKNLRIVDRDGNPIRPDGDFIHCDLHDHYEHLGLICSRCALKKRPTQEIRVEQQVQ